MPLSRVPKALWASLVVAALGFVVSISSVTRSSVGGVESCSAFDLAPILAAAGSLALVAVAVGERRRQHVDHRFPLAWLVGAGALVAAIAVVHVLRGLGIVGGPC